MRILHIYRSEPDRVVEELVEPWKRNHQYREFHLWRKPVDYRELLDLIFECDRVITWF